MDVELARLARDVRAGVPGIREREERFIRDWESSLPQPGEAAAHPMADARGTVTTFTIDRLSYTPSPPMVFAVVDFDGGGRLPVELTDVDAAAVQIGDRVELTFRRLSTADGVHNYFWKARPVREGTV